MRSSPTDAERALWHILRAKRLVGLKFRQQVRIDDYIADFVCFEHRLIVEADGSQHVESDYDTRRDAHLKAQGFHLLRFWNNDVLGNPDGVVTAILDVVESFAAQTRRAPLPSPPPQGGREKKEP